MIFNKFIWFVKKQLRKKVKMAKQISIVLNISQHREKIVGHAFAKQPKNSNGIQKDAITLQMKSFDKYQYHLINYLLNLLHIEDQICQQIINRIQNVKTVRGPSIKLQNSYDYRAQTTFKMYKTVQIIKRCNQLLIKCNILIQSIIILFQPAKISETIIQILSNLLHCCTKTCAPFILSIINKIINFIKMSQGILKFNNQQPIYCMVDIISVLMKENDRSKFMEFKSSNDKQQIYLKIIQTIFSLIDRQFVLNMDYNLLIRLYEMCFQCCNSNAQNIAITALFALTQNLFSVEGKNNARKILESFLHYLFENKKFTWIKYSQFKGLIWDLIIVGVKCVNKQFWVHIPQNIIKNLGTMYQLSVQHIFASGQNRSIFNTIINKRQQKRQSQKNGANKNNILDYVRFYRVFIFFSIYLGIQLVRQELQPIVQFLQYISFLDSFQQEITKKSFIFIEGICLLLRKYPNFPLTDQKGMILMNALVKISQKLGQTQQLSIQQSNDHSQLYIQNFCSAFPNATPFEFIKLIKNTIVGIRKDYLQEGDKIYEGQEIFTDRSMKSSARSVNIDQNNSITIKKRWQKLIRSLLRIISSLGLIRYKTRKNEPLSRLVIELLLQLQNWFILTPTHKMRNQILQQLSQRATIFETKVQIYKVCQCIQIGSNLWHGYYQLLDTTGLAIILKMFANVKSAINESNKFEQLEQIMTMADKLFCQQNLIIKKSFTKAIHGFMQCINTLIAEHAVLMEDNSQKYKNTQKMLNYIFDKFGMVLLSRPQFIQQQWEILTALLISICSNKCKVIQIMGIKFVEYIIENLLKVSVQVKLSLGQKDIVNLYLQLARSNTVNELLIEQVKGILPMLNQQTLSQMFKIYKHISLTDKNAKSVNEFQQLLIKQYLYKIQDVKYLGRIVEDFGNKVVNDNNQQYRLINLLWVIADHLNKLLAKSDNKKYHEQIESLCKILYKRFHNHSLHSKNFQFKKSIIHSLTQILAESINVFSHELVQQTFQKIYKELIYNLIDFQNIEFISDDDTQSRIDMMKISFKNFIKIVKKMKSQNIYSEEQVIATINQTYNCFAQLLRQSQQAYRSQNKTIVVDDYLFQLCKFVQQTISEGMLLNLQDKSNLLLLFKQIEQSMECIDKQTLCYKKRLTPMVNNLQKKIAKLNNQ